MIGARYMSALIWTCTSCGFAREGGQPTMECPICEAYKESFIDIPQHVEQQVRKQFGDDAANTAEARLRRKELLREGGFLLKFRVKGRSTEAVNQPGDSRRYH